MAKSVPCVLLSYSWQSELMPLMSRRAAREGHSRPPPRAGLCSKLMEFPFQMTLGVDLSPPKVTAAALSAGAEGSLSERGGH